MTTEKRYIGTNGTTIVPYAREAIPKRKNGEVSNLSVYR